MYISGTYTVCLYNVSAGRSNYCWETNQTPMLMKEFRHNPYAKRNRIKYLSTKLGITGHEARNWFDHQRYSIRRIEPQVEWTGEE